MWEGGRPRLIIDFQAERAVPKQSAECKPCAKVRVTDTPATRYITFPPPPPCLISALASQSPVSPSFSAELCCAVLCLVLSCAGTVPCPSVLGTQARGKARQGKARRRQGPSPGGQGSGGRGARGRDGWMGWNGCD